MAPAQGVTRRAFRSGLGDDVAILAVNRDVATRSLTTEQGLKGDDERGNT